MKLSCYTGNSSTECTVTTLFFFDAFANLLWYHNIEIVAIYCVIIRADKRSIFLGPLHVVALMTESEALAQKTKKSEGPDTLKDLHTARSCRLV